MRGREFDEVVCAGVSAVKWKANREPDADWSQISILIENLRQLRAHRFVLISTVDVYQRPLDVTEDDAADLRGSAYGVHRAKLERFVAESFPRSVIVRLPALYGPGLRKNAIYDLQHNNMVEAINPRGCFQWYDVSRLHDDLATIAQRDISSSISRLSRSRCQKSATASSPGSFACQICLRLHHATICIPGMQRSSEARETTTTLVSRCWPVSKDILGRVKNNAIISLKYRLAS